MEPTNSEVDLAKHITKELYDCTCSCKTFCYCVTNKNKHNGTTAFGSGFSSSQSLTLATVREISPTMKITIILFAIFFFSVGLPVQYDWFTCIQYHDSDDCNGEATVIVSLWSNVHYYLYQRLFYSHLQFQLSCELFVLYRASATKLMNCQFLANKSYKHATVFLAIWLPWWFPLLEKFLD